MRKTPMYGYIRCSSDFHFFPARSVSLAWSLASVLVIAPRATRRARPCDVPYACSHVLHDQSLLSARPKRGRAACSETHRGENSGNRSAHVHCVRPDSSDSPVR